jgi:hypothetical protein
MSLRDELEHAEVRFMKAVAERDLGYLEEHLAPEFSLTTGRPGYEVRNRAEWLEVTATSYVIESFAFAENRCEADGVGRGRDSPHWVADCRFETRRPQDAKRLLAQCRQPGGEQ